jgi:hypothetical protein
MRGKKRTQKKKGKKDMIQDLRKEGGKKQTKGY